MRQIAKLDRHPQIRQVVRIEYKHSHFFGKPREFFQVEHVDLLRALVLQKVKKIDAEERREAFELAGVADPTRYAA